MVRFVCCGGGSLEDLYQIYLRGNVDLSGSLFFFFKQKTAFEMRISDWSSDVCSSDLLDLMVRRGVISESDADQALATPLIFRQSRSEERRVGKECVSTCRSRW